MLNKQSKKQVFGGGLYFSSTVVIVASISNCAVNAEVTEEFTHFAHEISWRAYASLKVNDTSKNKWYQAKQYSDSIYNVIAKAIADCKMQKNEFKDPVTGNGIVEFDAKPDNANYTDENWNALVLWNFLAEAINGKLKIGIKDKFSKGCIEEVGKRIAEYYKKIEGIAGFVNKAVKDIQEYAQALGLYEYLRESKTDLYSNIQQMETDDCVTKVTITNAMIKGNDRNEQTEITVVYKDNNTLAYKVFDNRYVTLNQDMSINTEIKGTDPIYLYIDDGSEEQDKEYLESNQNIVAVLDLIDEMPVLHGTSYKVKQETEFRAPEYCYIGKFLGKIHYKRWYDRDTKYMVNVIKDVEKGFIKYVNAIYKTGEETTRDRLKTTLDKITKEHSCADTIDLMLEIMQKEAFEAVIPNGRREIRDQEAVVFNHMNVSGDQTVLLIDRTNETTIESGYAACIVKHGLNKEPDLQTEYPEVIITSLDSKEQNKAINNDVRIEEKFVIHNFNFGVPYRLLGVVTKDLSTGKIYTEVITEFDRAKRLYEKVQNAQTFRNDPNKLRLLAVYVQGYPVSE